MSHSFLPVNPCCTDVVLNTPCGYTSTLPNTSCGQNTCKTNITLSSNVLYNGPVLDCIIVEPCDTLNVILQKIDEIICNLLTQINVLNIQVNNITGQIININSQIININNTLDVCCNATTTTSTTLPPTTTTTTTVFIPTYCYTLTAIGRVAFFWIDVNGKTQTETVIDNTIYVCAQLDSIAIGGSGLPEVDGGVVPCTNDSDCAVITTTTTTLAPTTTSTTTETPTTTTTTTTTAL